MVRDFPAPGEHWIHRENGEVYVIVDAQSGRPTVEVRSPEGKKTRTVTLRFLFDRCRSPREHAATLRDGIREVLASLDRKDRR